MFSMLVVCSLKFFQFDISEEVKKPFRKSGRQCFFRRQGKCLLLDFINGVWLVKVTSKQYLLWIWTEYSFMNSPSSKQQITEGYY